MQRPENPYAAEFYALLEAMDRHIASRTIRAFAPPTGAGEYLKPACQLRIVGLKRKL